MVKEYIDKLLAENGEKLEKLQMQMKQLLDELNSSQSLLEKLQREKNIDINIFSPRSYDFQADEKIDKARSEVQKCNQNIEYLRELIETHTKKRQEYYDLQMEIERSEIQHNQTEENETGVIREDSAERKKTDIIREDSTEKNEVCIIRKYSTERNETGIIIEDSTERNETGIIIEDSTERNETGIIIEDSTERNETGIIIEDSTEKNETGIIRKYSTEKNKTKNIINEKDGIEKYNEIFDNRENKETEHIYTDKYSGYENNNDNIDSSNNQICATEKNIVDDSSMADGGIEKDKEKNKEKNRERKDNNDGCNTIKNNIEDGYITEDNYEIPDNDNNGQSDSNIQTEDGVIKKQQHYSVNDESIFLFLNDIYKKTELCLALINSDKNRCKRELKELKNTIRKYASEIENNTK